MANEILTSLDLSFEVIVEQVLTRLDSFGFDSFEIFERIFKASSDDATQLLSTGQTLLIAF